MKPNFLFLLLGCMLLSCHPPKMKHATPSDNMYAEGFSISTHEDYKQLTIFDPNDRKKVLACYYLIHDDDTQTPSDGIRIKVPLTRIAVTSTTQVGFLTALARTNIIVGACNPSLIYTPLDSVTDLGDEMHINAEKLMQLQPQAVFVCLYGADDNTLQTIGQMDIPVIYLTEWTEKHPLARAEWIRLVGALVGQQEIADSWFYEECETYQNIAESATKRTHQVMIGNNFRGTWYIPTGGTYMGQLLRDAGFQYAYSTDTTAHSLPLSIEQVLTDFADADIWLGAPTKTLDALAQFDKQHMQFKAYKNKQVYHFMARSTANGANDFWESGVCSPARILNDLNQIANDSIVDLYYVNPLK